MTSAGGSEQEVERAVAALADLDEIKPEPWAQLSAAGRVAALQEVETRLAAVQGRTACRVKAAPLHEAEYGNYALGTIEINERHLASLREVLETVIHEGRHAHQHHAAAGGQAKAWAQNLYGPEARPKSRTTHYIDADYVRDWVTDHKKSVVVNGRELTPEEIADWVYSAQPVEEDAWTYAQRICRALLGE